MRELNFVRETARRQSRNAQGLNPVGPRLTTPQVQAMALDPDILALDQEVEGLEPIMNPDGSFLFMFAFSAFGGPDAFG